MPHKASKSQFPQYVMPQLTCHLQQIRDDRNPVYFHHSQSRRNKGEKDQCTPVGYKCQLQHLHQIDDIKISYNKIDQKPYRRRETFHFSVKDKTREQSGKSKESGK